MFSTLLRLSFFLLSFIEGILSVKIIGFFILWTVFGTAHMVAFYAMCIGVSFATHKKYALFTTIVLAILEILYNQYMFFTSNGFALWFVLSGLGIILIALSLIRFIFAAENREKFMSEVEYVEEKAILYEWDTAKYLDEKRIAQKNDKKRFFIGLILLFAFILVSIIITTILP